MFPYDPLLKVVTPLHLFELELKAVPVNLITYLHVDSGVSLLLEICLLLDDYVNIADIPVGYVFKKLLLGHFTPIPNP